MIQPPYAQQYQGFPPQQGGFQQGGPSPYGGGFPPSGMQGPTDLYGPSQGMGGPQGGGQPNGNFFQHESGGIGAVNNNLDDDGGGFFSKLFSWKGLAAVATTLVVGFGLHKWLSGGKAVEETVQKTLSTLSKDLKEKAHNNFDAFQGALKLTGTKKKAQHKYLTALGSKTEKQLTEARTKLTEEFQGLTGLDTESQTAIDNFKQARLDAIEAHLKYAKDGTPVDTALKQRLVDVDKAYHEKVVTPLKPLLKPAKSE